jgi:Helix-turn-helix domain
MANTDNTAKVVSGAEGSIKSIGSDPKTIERRTMRLWPEFGRTLGLGKNAAYDGARRGDFKTIRIGKRILVPTAEVERLLEGRMA